MMRNVEHTKQRLLDAATAEFAERGFAGARIDRIAEMAGANKALIYTYFGNKEQLFRAALGGVIERVVQDVPIDGADLPGYAARRFDWQRDNADTNRLLNWAQLEHVDIERIPALMAAGEVKLRAVTRAQRDGIVSDRFTAGELLSLINALITAAAPGDADDATVATRRQSIVDAVRLLVEP
jgi:AcrR family transcriptional regulator